MMRVWYEVLGGHTHIKVFTGRYFENGTLGCATSNFIMTNDEFEAWKNGTIKLEFVESRRVHDDVPQVPA